MEPWVWVVFWWLAFAASHTLLSSRPLRPALIGKLGGAAFMGLYSLIALAVFTMLVRSYFGHRHDGPLWWQPRDLPGAETLAIVIAVLGWSLIVASYLRPSPVSLLPGARRQADGLLAITRHPLFVGIALWGGSHLLLYGYASDVAFFGGFLLYGVLGAAHQDRRQRLKPQLQPFYQTTSLLPFAAIVGGRNRLRVGELPWVGLLAGVAVAGGIYYLHFWLRGA